MARSAAAMATGFNGVGAAISCVQELPASALGDCVEAPAPAGLASATAKALAQAPTPSGSNPSKPHPLLDGAAHAPLDKMRGRLAAAMPAW